MPIIQKVPTDPQGNKLTRAGEYSKVRETNDANNNVTRLKIGSALKPTGGPLPGENKLLADLQKAKEKIAFNRAVSQSLVARLKKQVRLKEGLTDATSLLIRLRDHEQQRIIDLSTYKNLRMKYKGLNK